MMVNEAVMPLGIDRFEEVRKNTGNGYTGMFF